MMRFKIVCFAAAVLLAASPVMADTGDDTGAAPAATGNAGRASSFEIFGGAEVLTSQGLGSSTATLTSNSTAGTPYDYFTLTGTRATAPAFGARLGYNITSMFTVEGGFLFSRGDVQGTVSSDVEGATAPTITERMTQYFIDVSVLAHLRAASFAKGAGIPFLEGGIGYLRQSHENSVAINTGQIYHFGGGVTYLFRQASTGRLKAMGVRITARAYVPHNGYTVGSSSQQIFLGVGGGLVLMF